jgi:uncharacterized protein (TIGR04255 family)
MAEYLPFAGKNAIVEMAVGIQFQSQFDSRIGAAVEVIKSDFAKDFPKFEPLQQFTLNIGAPFPFPAAPSSPGFAGFILTRVKPDSSPARILRAMGNTVSIHFMEYDSWQQTKSKAIDYFDRCFRLMGVMAENPVVAVFMRYIDRFTFDGDLQAASAGLLFRENPTFLPSVIFNSGNLWHSNSGWYEVLIGEMKALNNLSVMGVLQPTPSITVDHTNVYSLPKPCNSSVELFDGAQNQHSVIAILDRQHLANTIILKNLLNQTMLDTIGLKG